MVAKVEQILIKCKTRTVKMQLLSTLGSVILATPPCLRISAGTLSKDITAHAFANTKQHIWC